ncbi:MAG: DUF3568 family protein [Candidatus Omnitrophota bacterium]|jgi:hypothetical protein|nr:MAG: DUF3568 family protein [Candidatus Omnitrophota bacterium]
MKQFVSLIAVVCFCVIFSRCAGVLMAGGAAAGTVAYINGELKQFEAVGIDHLWLATQTASKAMELHTVESEKDALTARLQLKGANDQDIYINLKSMAVNRTEIRIRINVFGDEKSSQRILSEIEKRL